MAEQPDGLAAREPEPEDLRVALAQPCTCECPRCDQGSHCNNRRKGCTWQLQLVRAIRPGSR